MKTCPEIAKSYYQIYNAIEKKYFLIQKKTGYIIESKPEKFEFVEQYALPRPKR